MMETDYKALYIHIPFCKCRCRYCDFDTDAVAADDPCVQTYVDDLVLQIRRAAKEGKLAHIETVYLGGGTPSYIGTKHLSSILYMLSISLNNFSQLEVSMESNPDSITPELIRDIWALGVNRLSIGVQSLDDQVLKALGRAHDADKARAAIKMALERFDNVSVDMMCGIPSQDSEVFCQNLQEVVDLGVSHVSIYPLTIESGTPLEAAIDAGEIPDVVEDEQAMMMQMAASVLEPAGLERYEVASYAKPGKQCRHNIAYWTGIPYLGIGRSAVTMNQTQKSRIRIQDGEVTDELDAKQMVAEDLMLGMRMTCGVSEDQVRQAALLLPDIYPVMHSLVRDNLVVLEDGRYKPTLGGWLCGNVLFGRIFELAP